MLTLCLHDARPLCLCAGIQEAVFWGEPDAAFPLSFTSPPSRMDVRGRGRRRVGRDGFIVAGSDDGRFFVWDRRSTQIVATAVADQNVVNCVQVRQVCCRPDLSSLPLRVQRSCHSWSCVPLRVFVGRLLSAA